MPTQYIWPGWVADSTSVTTVTAVVYDTSSVWLTWNDAYPPTGASQAWTYWNATASSYTNARVVVPEAPRPVETPEQRAVRQRQQGILRNRARAHRLRQNVARRRAEALLLEHLDVDQRAEWAASRSFHVATADGVRRYRIKLGLAGNVALVKDGELEPRVAGGHLRRFCMHVYHPDGKIPDEDNVLAQKLLLESDEAEFLRLANVL